MKEEGEKVIFSKQKNQEVELHEKKIREKKNASSFFFP